MLKPSLCDYRDVYILVQGTITITGDARAEPEPETAARTPEQIQAARQTDEKKE